MRCRQQTRKTEGKLSNALSPIKVKVLKLLKMIPMRCRQKTRKTESKLYGTL